MRELLLQFIIILFSINVIYPSNPIITGKISGYNNKPLALAHAHLMRDDSDTIVYSSKCDSNGNFLIPFCKIGFNEIKFTGVNHKSQKIFIFLNESIDSANININLEPNIYASDNDSIFIFGNINGFEPKNIIKMKYDSGLFKYKFKFKSDTIIYQLVNATKEKFERSINGTQFNDCSFDGQSDYYSIVIDTNSIKELVFNPDLLPDKDVPLTISSSNLVIDTFLKDYIKIIKEKKAFYEDFQNVRESNFLKKIYYFLFNKIDRMIKDRLAELEERIKKNNDKAINKIYKFEYLVYAAMPSSFYQKRVNFADTNLINEILTDISPTSNFWLKRTDGYPDIAFVVSSLLTKNHTYFDSLINNNPIPFVREKNIKAALEWYANFEPDKEKKEFYYNKLIAEFPSSISAIIAERRYSPNRKVQSGKKCPDFSFVQYNEKSKSLNNDSLKGKYILIDFWATWCGPCINEFNNLEKMYEKYNNFNIQFISISFDISADKVDNFRKTRYKLPWFNVVETDGFKSYSARAFEVIAIPKIILVDPEGKIIASDSELRGEKLDRILTKIFINK